eukprot:8164-Heterococcus_DN1.PRE.23
MTTASQQGRFCCSNPALTQVRLTGDKRSRRRCHGDGIIRFRTTEQANAAVQGMRSFEFQRGRFLHALPNDENRTLLVTGLAESWNPEIAKAVLLYAFPGMLSSAGLNGNVLKTCRRAQLIARKFQHALSNGMSCSPSMRCPFHRMSCIVNKTDTSKTRPICFVEFNDHAQASMAHAVNCLPAAPDQHGCSTTDGSRSLAAQAAADGSSCLDKSSKQAAPHMPVHTGAAESSSTAADAAKTSLQAGAELTVDWADPVRLHNHVYDCTSPLREAAATDDDTATYNASSTRVLRRHESFIPLPCQLLPEHHVSSDQQLPPLRSTRSLHQAHTEDCQPKHQQMSPLPAHSQDTGGNISSSDFRGLSVLQLNRLHRLQTEHDEIMSRSARCT